MGNSKDELQELMPYMPDYHCRKCGTLLAKPKLRSVGYDLGGGVILYGEFRCPNDRWWRHGHTVLGIHNKSLELTVFDRTDDNLIVERLWEHDLRRKRLAEIDNEKEGA